MLKDYKILKVILFVNLVLNKSIFSADWLITTSGTYVIDDDLLSTNADANGAIRIQSSYVTLDLAGRFIKQNNATAGANGIVVDANLTDIVIKNGTINGFTRCGLTVNSGCSVISLQNLTIESCAIRAMEILGTSVSPIMRSEVLNCSFFGNCSSASTDNLLTLSQCQNVTVSKCIIENNSPGTTSNFNVVKYDNCTNCVLKDAILENNGGTVSGSTLTSITLHFCTACLFSNCIVQNYTSNFSLLQGIGNFGSDSVLKNNVFDDCKVINLTCNATGPTIIAYVLADFLTGLGSGSNNICRRCLAAGLFSNGSNGNGRIDGFLVYPGFLGCVFEDCRVFNYVQGGNNIQGFDLDAVGGSMRRCISSYGASSFSLCTVTGVRFSSSDWELRDCDVSQNNNTANGANSNGFLGAATNSCVTNNITVAPQNSSFPAGSESSTTSATLAGVTAPWTNLLVTS